VAPDALIVGSGPNGLAAAITLALAGRRVLVLEAAPRAGGALATEELTLPGFLHDTFSAVHPAAAASPAFAEMSLESHGLRWMQPAACFAHPLPGGSAIALYPSIERTAASLDGLHPGDGARWARFAEPLLENFGSLRDTMLAPFPPVRGAARLARALGPLRALALGRASLMSADALASDLFSGAGSRARLQGSAMHSDLAPDRAGSAVAALYLNMLGHAVGWPSPEGGAGMLARALLSCLHSLGGEVRTGARVTRIAAQRGNVSGVQLDSGERIAAPLVIADVMPAALVRLAGEELPRRYARAMLRYRMGPAALKVDWALGGPIPWSAQEVREAGTVHISSAGETPAGDARGRMLLGQQSIADPSRAPAGRHTAWAYSRTARPVRAGPERERRIELMEAEIERFAPGFRERILARHVLSSQAMERRNANLIGGDVGGGSYTPAQILFRPVPSLCPYRTPLRGLLIGSAAAYPGGGVHGVPGWAAARAAIARGG
jgi:phytoene dehydrogenase-like protein